MEQYCLTIAGASYRVGENSDSSGRSDNSPRPIERMITEEPEHPSVPKENSSQANEELCDRTRVHPEIISFESIHEEETTHLENEPPIEANRNNRRNLIQRSMDQMRNCPINYDFLKPAIILVGCGGLGIIIYLATYFYHPTMWSIQI